MLKRKGRSKSPGKLKISGPSNPTKGGVPLERVDNSTHQPPKQTNLAPSKHVDLVPPKEPDLIPSKHHPLTRSTSFANFFKNGFSGVHDDQDTKGELLSIDPTIIADITKSKNSSVELQLPVPPSIPPPQRHHHPILSKVKSAITDHFPHYTSHKRAKSLNSSAVLHSKFSRSSTSFRANVSTVDEAELVKLRGLQEQIRKREAEEKLVNTSPKLSRFFKGTPKLEPPIYASMHSEDALADSTLRTKSLSNRSVGSDTYEEYLRQYNSKMTDDKMPIGLGVKPDQGKVKFNQSAARQPEHGFVAHDFNPTGPMKARKFVPLYDVAISGLRQHPNVLDFIIAPAKAPVKAPAKVSVKAPAPIPMNEDLAHKRDGIVLSGDKTLDVVWKPEHYADPTMSSPFDDAANGVRRDYAIPTFTLKRASDSSKRGSAEAGLTTGSPKSKRRSRSWQTEEALSLWGSAWDAEEANLREMTKQSLDEHKMMPSLRDTSCSTLFVERGDSPERPPVPALPSPSERLKKLRARRQTMPTPSAAASQPPRIETTTAISYASARVLTGEVRQREGALATMSPQPEHQAEIGRAITMDDGLEYDDWDEDEGTSRSSEGDELGLDWEWDEDEVGVAR